MYVNSQFPVVFMFRSGRPCVARNPVSVRLIMSGMGPKMKRTFAFQGTKSHRLWTCFCLRIFRRIRPVNFRPVTRPVRSYGSVEKFELSSLLRYDFTLKCRLDPVALRRAVVLYRPVPSVNDFSHPKIRSHHRLWKKTAFWFRRVNS